MKERAKSWLLKILVILWALAFAQGPFFIDQYRGVLTGHVEELKYQLAQLESIMGISYFEMERTLTEMTKSSQAEVAKAGKFMLQMVQRYDAMQKGWQALTDSNPFVRPFTFIRNLNWDFMKETCQHYTFGLPFTIEALLFAVVGGLLGWGVYFLIIYASEQMGNLFKKEEK